MANKDWLLGIGIVLVLSISFVQSASVVVTSSTGSGSGSLVYVLANAHAGDYITFDSSITTVTVDSFVELKSVDNVTIDGEGRVSVNSIDPVQLIRITSTTNTSIVNLEIVADMAIYVQTSSNFVVNKCNVYGQININSSNTIGVMNTKVNQSKEFSAIQFDNTNNIIITNNQIYVPSLLSLALRQFFGIVFEGCAHIIIGRNYFEGYGAIAYQYTSFITVNNNNINATSFGVMAANGAQLTIEDNQIYGSDPIFLFELSSIVINGNSITCGNDGIEIFQCDSIMLNSNQIYGHFAIICQYSNNVVAINNTVITDYGFYFNTVINGTIESNNMPSQNVSGILAEYAINIVIARNRLKAPGAANVGVSALACETVNISHNYITITGSAQLGIVSVESDRLIVEFNAVKGANIGIGLTKTINASVNYNQVSNCGNGIELECVLSSLLQFNTISFNTGVGLFSNCSVADFGGRNAFDANLIGFNSRGGIEEVQSDQTAPTIESVTRSSYVAVSASVTELQNQDYVFEFFANQACDPLGLGQGEIYLGKSSATSNASGKAQVTFFYDPNQSLLSANGSLVDLSSACFITATSSRLSSGTSSFQFGDVTSQFSNCFYTCVSSTPSISQTASTTPSTSLTASATMTPTSSVSDTATPTKTATSSSSLTASPTPTKTVTSSISLTASSTKTPSASHSNTGSPSRSKIVPASSSVHPSGSNAASASPSKSHNQFDLNACKKQAAKKCRKYRSNPPHYKRCVAQNIAKSCFNF